jgi:hypothetical protein
MAATLVAQAVPTTQPRILNIYREIEKPNHTVAHMATEARWADFNRKAGYPTTYFGLVAASGPAEAWWLSSFDNFEAFGKNGAFEGTPTYAAGLARIQAEDADHVANFIAWQARGMPEVSYGAFPEMAKNRVYSIMTVRTKPGYETAFGEIAGHYKMIAEGNSGIAGWRAYEVIAGAPGGTYLVFTSFPSWAAVDANDAAWARAMGGAAAHMEAAGKLARESIVSTEVRYFNVNPAISLVPKEMAAADPFWAPKPAPSAQKP